MIYIMRVLANYSEEVTMIAWNSITEAVWQYAYPHGTVNLEGEAIHTVGKD